MVYGRRMFLFVCCWFFCMVFFFFGGGGLLLLFFLFAWVFLLFVCFLVFGLFFVLKFCIMRLSPPLVGKFRSVFISYFNTEAVKSDKTSNRIALQIILFLAILLCMVVYIKECALIVKKFAV